jgi:hypothetical protein
MNLHTPPQKNVASVFRTGKKEAKLNGIKRIDFNSGYCTSTFYHFASMNFEAMRHFQLHQF